MKIVSIELYNWQPFRGKGGDLDYPPTTLNFDCIGESTTNNSIVIGDNTEGKSSLWDAFYFALYGRVPIWSKNHLEPIGNRRTVGEDVLIQGKLPLLNMGAYKDRDYYFGVKLSFELNGEEFTLVRYCDKNTGVTIPSEDTMHHVLRITDSSAKEKDNPQRFINSILPETIAPFTLFDGEKLEHYRSLMMDQETADVRGSIERITRLTMFVKGKDALNIILKRADKSLEFEQQAFVSKGKQAEHASKAFAAFQDAKNEYEELMDERKTTYAEKIRIETALEKHRDQKIRLEKIRYQEKIIKDTEEDISELRTKLKKCMSKSWILILKSNLDAEYSTLVDTIQRQEKELKSVRDFEKKIQSNRDEISGNPCSECKRPHEKVDSATKTRLKLEIEEYESEIEALEIARISPSPEYLWTKKQQIRETLDKISNRMPEAKGYSDDILIKEGKRDDAKTAYRNLVSKNSEINEEEIDTLDREFKKIMKLIGVLDKERISKANKVEETKKKWAQYNIGDEDGKEIKRPKSLIDAENKALLIREMITVLEKSMAPYREGMRKTVEKKTNTLFKLLTNQKMFKDIKKPITMSKDFKLKLHHSEGIDQGSTGQNALVSYALTLALSECSGIEFPMIIDTPFRSIGHGIKKKLLPHLLKYNRQIILIPVLDECMSMDEVEAVKKDLSTIHLVKNAKPWYSIVNELHRRD
jgi:hypothetical protein